MPRPNVNLIVSRLLESRETITNRDVVAEAGISRQAVHRHLEAMVGAGRLTVEGAGRGVKYRRIDKGEPLEEEWWRFPIETASGDDAFTEVEQYLEDVPKGIWTQLHFAVHQLVSNAIEHSGSPHVDLQLERSGDALAFEVIDEGVGIFEHLQARLGLARPLLAIDALPKSKEGSLPFLCRIADVIELESGRLRCVVDNLRGDAAVVSCAERVGTRARFELAPTSARPLAAIEAAYHEDRRLRRVPFPVRLLDHGVRFLSREEAQRLTRDLDRFEEVVLDFHGVEGVGQGFVHEVFGVWAAKHPGTRLSPRNMSEAVEFMVTRGAGG